LEDIKVNLMLSAPTIWQKVYKGNCKAEYRVEADRYKISRERQDEFTFTSQISAEEAVLLGKVHTRNY
jgi:hypothetical protein